MPAATPEKLVIVATHGGENPEKATIPFVVGGAALAMETKVTVILQSQGVTLAAQGLYEHVHAPGFDPVKKLVDTFLELGGSILVCIPCLEARHIAPASLVPGAQMVKSGRLVQELLEAKAVVSY